MAVTVALAGCAGDKPAASNVDTQRGAISGRLQRVDYFYSIKPDCSPAGAVEVRVSQAPAHGTARAEGESDFPNFASTNVRHVCNAQKVPVMQVYYQSEAGYSGPDTFAIDILYPSGETRHESYAVTVWPSQR